MRSFSKIVACISAIAMSVVTVASPCSASKKGSADIYYSHKNSSMKIALTFDDGPHPRLTPKILDILDKYDIKATFFVIGVNATYYPDALKQAVSRGHEIANHTLTHPHLSDADENTLISEISACQKEIYNITGVSTSLFRPPEGFIKGSVETAAVALNYKVILWDIDTRDWAHTPPHDIYKNVVNNVKSGDVILMHDFIGHNSPTPESLEMFIPELLSRGYKFVTVSELIETND